MCALLEAQCCLAVDNDLLCVFPFDDPPRPYITGIDFFSSTKIHPITRLKQAFHKIERILVPFLWNGGFYNLGIACQEYSTLLYSIFCMLDLTSFEFHSVKVLAGALSYSGIE